MNASRICAGGTSWPGPGVGWSGQAGAGRSSHSATSLSSLGLNTFIHFILNIQPKALKYIDISSHGR